MNNFYEDNIWLWNSSWLSQVIVVNDKGIYENNSYTNKFILLFIFYLSLTLKRTQKWMNMYLCK